MPVTQTGSYIPDSDLELRSWLNNFASIVAQNPSSFGLSTIDSQTLNQLSEDFSAALDVTESALTRTSPAIAEKDAIRNQAVETFRMFAMQIKQNQGVSDLQKTALGIHIDDNTKTPVPTPTTEPLLAILEAQSGYHVLTYRDSGDPTSVAKPAGAIQIQIYVAIGDEPTADPSDAQYYGSFTRQPFKVEYDPSNAGKTATIFGRWITRTGKVGNFSLPVAMLIAFGGPVELQSAA